MIFVTVGAQMPFDRLIKAVDRWAWERGRSDVTAQIGSSSYHPSSMEWEHFLAPRVFMARCLAARAIVAHAGTGTIITALRLGKPILVMPRRAWLCETRNDHQVATAQYFLRYPSVLVAENEKDFFTCLDLIENVDGRDQLGSFASPELIEKIRNFIVDY